MFLTQENYKQIQEWLKSNAIKDTEFNDASLPFDGSEYLAFVQNGENVKVLVTDFTQELAALGIFDIVIKQETGDDTTSTMSQAAITEKLQELLDEINSLSLFFDSSTDQLSLYKGNTVLSTADLSNLRDAINANTDLIINAHANVSLSASTSIIERGVDTSVTLTGTASFNDSTELITIMVVTNMSTGSTVSSTTSPVTLKNTISSTTTFRLLVGFNNDAVEKSVTKTIYAYYPIYIVTSSEVPTATTDITNGEKQTISSTAAGTYTTTTSVGDYIFLCVPSGVTVPTSATMSGFDCPITNIGSIYGVSVNGVSVTYTLIQTVNAMKADTLTITYS